MLSLPPIHIFALEKKAHNVYQRVYNTPLNMYKFTVTARSASIKIHISYQLRIYFTPFNIVCAVIVQAFKCMLGV